MKKLPLILDIAGVVLCMLFLLRLCSAATYYVSNTNGNDSNSCTTATNINSPKHNIAGVNGGMSCLLAGDTLLIRAGTYTEAINSNIQTIPTGTSWTNAPRISAYPGSAPYEVVTLNGNSGGQVINLGSVSVKYVIFEGFVIDGVSSTTFGVSSNGASFIRFKNVEVKNHTKSGIIIGAGALPDPALTYVEFDGVIVHNNGSSELDHGFYVNTCNNSFHNSTIYSNWGYGIQIYNGSGHRVNNNVIYANRLHDNGITSPNGGGIVTGSGDLNLIYNNLIYGNKDGVLVASNAPTNQKILNNTIYNNARYGVQVQTGTGGVVQNNIIYLNATANEQYLVTTTHDHNLLTDPIFVNAGTFDFHIQSSSPAKDVGISLSTIFTTDFDGYNRPQGSGWDEGAYEYVINVPPPLSTISVTYPTAGANVHIGSVVVIRWTTNDTHNAKIELSRDSGATYPETIVASVPQTADANNAYSWTATAPSSPTAMIKVTNLFDSIFDESPLFNLRGHNIKILP